MSNSRRLLRSIARDSRLFWFWTASFGAAVALASAAAAAAGAAPATAADTSPRAAARRTVAVASGRDRDRAAQTAVSRPASAAERPPNIVLILADDLGYGDLASYGHPLIRTPRLDALAREGTRLTSYYAGAPSCTPSRAALLTGRYPIRVGLPQVLGPEAKIGLPPAERTLAGALKARGYRTQMVGKWHLGHATPDLLPTARGFDHWLGLPYSNDMKPPFVQTTVPLRLYRDTAPIEGDVDQDALTVRYTEEAVRFINDAADAPFFLYLAHNMPHLPIHAPARFRGRSAAGLYGDVIEMLDWSTGEILDALAARGLDRSTIVIFTSDNGPWLNLPARMLQEGNEPWHAGSAGLLRGAKGTTWEGGMRVPAIVRWPGHVAAGQASAALTTSMDLHATLRAAAGAGVAGAGGAGETMLPGTRDGRDLTTLLAGREQGVRDDTFFYFQDANLQGVREGPWKVRKAGTEPATLFHLDLDPSEQFDRAVQHPEIVARLLARMAAFAGDLASEGHAPVNRAAVDSAAASVHPPRP